MFAFRRLLLVARKVSNKYPVLPNHCHFYIDLLNIGYLMFIQCTCVFTYAPSAVKDSEQQWIKQLSFCFIASLLNLGSWFCKCTHYLFVWNQHKIYGFYFVFAHEFYFRSRVKKQNKPVVLWVSGRDFFKYTVQHVASASVYLEALSSTPRVHTRGVEDNL